jgi:hypothetical protein
MKAVAAGAGLLMVAATVLDLTDWALWLVVPAAVLAILGVFARYVATGAVLTAVGLLALGTPSMPVAAAAGLAATAYLLAAHADLPAVQPITLISVASSVGFTAVALVAASIPHDLAWVPVAAPVLVALLYAGAVFAGRGAGRATL